MNKNEMGGAVFLLALGAFFCLGARILGLGRISDPGPGFFPFWLGLGLFLVSLALIRKSRQKADRSSSSGSWQGARWDKIVFSLTAMLLYAFFLESVGYLLVSFSLMLFLFRRIGSQRWTTAVVGSFLISALSYVLFKVLLQLRLPEGFFGI